MSSSRAELARARADGSTSRRSRSRPSAFDTTFCATATTSPSPIRTPAASAARGDQRAPGRRRGAISGRPVSGRGGEHARQLAARQLLRSIRPQRRRGCSRRASGVSGERAPAARRGRRGVSRSSASDGTSRDGEVEARSCACSVWRSSEPGPKLGLERPARDRAPARWSRSRGGRARSRRPGRVGLAHERVELAPGRAAGSRRAPARRARTRARRRAPCRPARPGTGPASSRSATDHDVLGAGGSPPARRRRRRHLDLDARAESGRARRRPSPRPAPRASRRPGRSDEPLLGGVEALDGQDRCGGHAAKPNPPAPRRSRASRAPAVRARPPSAISVSVSSSTTPTSPRRPAGERAVDHHALRRAPRSGRRCRGRSTSRPAHRMNCLGRPLERPAADQRADRDHRRVGVAQRLAHSRAPRGSGRCWRSGSRGRSRSPPRPRSRASTSSVTRACSAPRNSTPSIGGSACWRIRYSWKCRHSPSVRT